MTKRGIIKSVLQNKKPQYVPWSFSFTVEAKEKLQNYFKTSDLEDILNNHILELGDSIGFFEYLGNDLYKDAFGVIWDRSVDKDIGIVKGQVLKEPNLKNYQFPDPCAPRFFEDIPEKIKKYGDRFRLFQIGFSLYERAWTLRGIETIMMDFYDNPKFVRHLFDSIADYNIAQINEALKYDIDAFEFGDDWGQQNGLQMGPHIWFEFIYPSLKRMFKTVKKSNKYIFIHSCGDVDELFDDLIDIGLDCFNPFQPEVMDVQTILRNYRKKLSFFGGLSTQRTLPFGTIEEVKKETRKLLQFGKAGNYIFAPSHAVEGDVPIENMLAFIEEVHNQ